MQYQAEPRTTAKGYSKEGDRSDTKENSNESADQNTHTPLLEWLMAFLGLILVAGSIGFLLYQAITTGDSPPNIIVRTSSTTPIENGYLVTFQVTNQGESTAKGLVVEGQLKNDKGEVETSETTLDYVPARSEREGGLFFTQNPEQFELQLRAVGYEQP